MYNDTATFAASNGYRITTTTRDYYASGAANFNNSMLIVLAALMCALICVLGLNSLVRCGLRFCSHRYSFDRPERVASVKKRALSRIPVVAYKSEVSVAVTDCPICLGEFSDGEKVRVLPKCNHGFHVKCIDKWLLSHSTCPICRQPPLEIPRIAEEVNINGADWC